MGKATAMPATVLAGICFPAFFILLCCAAGALGAESPMFAPFIDNVCKAVSCGKGTCKSSSSNLFIPYVCECEDGWKRMVNTTGFEFMPCIIPNCTVDYSCNQQSPPPPPAVVPQFQLPNSSIFDPCKFAYCGEGTCMKNSTFGYTCQCKEGAANLMKLDSLPCMTKCNLGADCSGTGIAIGKQPPSSEPVTSPNSSKGLSRSVKWFITCALVGLMVPAV
ncbi:uncharacterized protein LOC116259106 [Nymphaea colorata]|nr:uncharacterized protein LOC116259106 [Nymphaea colorata]